MSVELLEMAAAVLGPLTEHVVFFGGATVGIWFTDPTARQPRITYDVEFAPPTRNSPDSELSGSCRQPARRLVTRSRPAPASESCRLPTCWLPSSKHSPTDDRTTEPDLRAYVSDQIARLLALRAFTYGAEGALASPDARSRVETVTLPRLRALIRQR